MIPSQIENQSHEVPVRCSAGIPLGKMISLTLVTAAALDNGSATTADVAAGCSVFAEIAVAAVGIDDSDTFAGFPACSCGVASFCISANLSVAVMRLATSERLPSSTANV